MIYGEKWRKYLLKIRKLNYKWFPKYQTKWLDRDLNLLPLEVKGTQYEQSLGVIKIVSDNILEIQKITITTLKENNYNYNVTLEIGNFYFPTKYYGNISMPARKLRFT